MAKVRINRQKCKGCLLCVSFCSRGLLAVEEKFNLKGVKPVFFTRKQDCIGCLQCAIICPEACITIYQEK